MAIASGTPAKLLPRSLGDERLRAGAQRLLRLRRIAREPGRSIEEAHHGVSADPRADEERPDRIGQRHREGEVVGARPRLRRARRRGGRGSPAPAVEASRRSPCAPTGTFAADVASGRPEDGDPSIGLLGRRTRGEQFAARSSAAVALPIWARLLVTVQFRPPIAAGSAAMVWSVPGEAPDAKQSSPRRPSGARAHARRSRFPSPSKSIARPAAKRRPGGATTLTPSSGQLFPIYRERAFRGARESRLLALPRRRLIDDGQRRRWSTESAPNPACTACTVCGFRTQQPPRRAQGRGRKQGEGWAWTASNRRVGLSRAPGSAPHQSSPRRPTISRCPSIRSLFPVAPGAGIASERRGGRSRSSKVIDYYMEGENFVFTETYHPKRGHCCKLALSPLPLATWPGRSARIAAPHRRRAPGTERENR